MPINKGFKENYICRKFYKSAQNLEVYVHLMFTIFNL